MTLGDIFVFAEYTTNRWLDGSLEAIQEGARVARQTASNLVVITIGTPCADLDAVLEKQPIQSLISVEHPLLTTFSTDGYVIALSQLIEQYMPSLFIASATLTSQDFIPRLCARLKAPLVSNCVRISLGDNQRGFVFVKPTHYGQFYTTFACEQTPAFAMLLPGAIGIQPPSEYSPIQVKTFTPHISPDDIRTSMLERTKGDPRSIDIREASVIIGAGRGVAESDCWQTVESLADLLQAPIAGTRPLLDQGLVRRERVIGQTGKNVKPDVYIALGISGAYYHIQGINPASTIVAVNIDRKAPIFTHSKLGIVGDLRQILPEIIDRLQKLKRD
ncbi:MAG: electron transfer flavoprotein subunit alpha/FixB family protein [Anaerolineae bacterium]|nr:electron transfer flavoprotein subunit alpha/FixB family protein [Anaerolineae bacterium]